MIDEALLALAGAANLLAAYYWCKSLIWALNHWRSEGQQASK
jgi:hypothetical protein